LNFMRGSRWTYPNMTAAYGLFLYLPEKRLQILGGDSVFAHTPPKGLKKAARLYREKRWEELKRELNGKTGPGALDTPAGYARGLLDAYERLDAHARATLGIVEKSMADGRMKTAALQLDLLAKMMGGDSPETAKLREQLGDDPGKAKETPQKKPDPLIDRAAITKELGLAKGGIRDGWAHAYDYISEINRRGFDGMAPEKIAPFLGHFNGGVAGGAAKALAARGDAVMPLLKRLLTDTHPGVRAGAVETLKLMYAAGIESYRSEVPDDLVGVIRLVRPLLDDESRLVRSAVSSLVVDLKVLNDIMYEMMGQLALQGANVGAYVRHGVKDPVVRTRLAMAIVDGNNRRGVKSPGSYIPMICVTSAHEEQCEPYIQTAVDTILNPEVQIMYGFFSNHPEDAALHIFSRYVEHPLVLENLPAIMRISFRRGGNNVFWDVHKEFPHRIAIQLGPKSLPIIEAFWRDMTARVTRIAAGEEDQPHWWQPTLQDRLDSDRAEWADTAGLIRCLHGDVSDADALAGMVAHCFKDRWWAAWERARIWDNLVERGPGAVPALKRLAKETHARAVAAIGTGGAEPGGDRKAQQKAEEKAAADRKALDTRLAELEQLASLIENLHAKDPSARHVQALCAFYLRRPYGAWYPYIKEGDVSYMRPLHATQDAQVRDTLMHWGRAALPVIRRHLAEDREVLAGLQRKLDEEEAFWKPQWSRKSGGPLRRIANEREELVRMRDELRDLADLVDLTSREDKLDAAQLDTLCGIYTRYDWPVQRALVLAALKRQPASFSDAVGRHARDVEVVLAEAEKRVAELMGNTVNDLVKVNYNHAKGLAASIRSGLAELQQACADNQP